MAEYIHESGGPLFHIGRYILMIKRCFTKPERTIMYWKETMRQMVNIGVGSVIIILLISFFIGAVTSTQFAYNLSTSMVPMYFVGYVVKESMILELAPTISGLILAGKVGSNLASELGTMRLTEQIDALEIMGVNTFSYLIGPKLAAAIIMVQKNINVMLIKATVFGFIITSISCYQGFYASGSALEIGKASTKAVVLSSVMVLVADFVLAWLLLN